MSTKKTAFVYVGPSRPFGLPIKQNTIIAGDPEEAFPDLWQSFREHKNFKKLFVPVPELAAARAAMKNPGSALCVINQEISKASAAFKAARAGQ